MKKHNTNIPCVIDSIQLFSRPQVKPTSHIVGILHLFDLALHSGCIGSLAVIQAAAQVPSKLFLGIGCPCGLTPLLLPLPPQLISLVIQKQFSFCFFLLINFGSSKYSGHLAVAQSAPINHYIFTFPLQWEL